MSNAVVRPTCAGVALPAAPGCQPSRLRLSLVRPAPELRLCRLRAAECRRQRARIPTQRGFLKWGSSGVAHPPPAPVAKAASSFHSWTVITPKLLGVGVAVAVLTVCVVRRLVRASRRLRRPYLLREEVATDTVSNPEEEIVRAVTFIQDNVIRPIDRRFRGNAFSSDLNSFPFTPMVLVIGNHSSGKSTFINSLLGKQVQQTGVAPTDDGFTILERVGPPNAEISVEDGPTVLGCPKNRAFRELQRFGDAFLSTLRRKCVVLPDDAAMPFGLQIVDSPGMIDIPGRPEGTKGRGYNFLEAVRWWAAHADVILLLFDPDKPGTTGESLEVLTRSLSGMEHKFRVVLNKVDCLDSTVDFARAYGTLGWALSKVIERKDIPLIYPIYNEGFETRREGKDYLPLHEFHPFREELVAEVFRAKARHYDNVVTDLERKLWQVEMITTVLMAIRKRLFGQFVMASIAAVLGLVVPVAAAGHVLYKFGQPPLLLSASVGALFAAVYTCGVVLVCSYLHQSARLQTTGENLDAVFNKEYSDFFIFDDGNNYLARWQIVRPKIATMLQAQESVAFMPRVASWEIARLKECLSENKDIWYLRQLARANRLPQQKKEDVDQSAQQQKEDVDQSAQQQNEDVDQRAQQQNEDVDQSAPAT